MPGPATCDLSSLGAMAKNSKRSAVIVAAYVGLLSRNGRASNAQLHSLVFGFASIQKGARRFRRALRLRAAARAGLKPLLGFDYAGRPAEKFRAVPWLSWGASPPLRDRRATQCPLVACLDS